MTRYLLALLLAFVVPPALAVTAVADLPTQTTTHCTFQVDGAAWGADVPSVTVGGVRVCALDVTGIAAGAHSILVKAVVVDPLWGRLESAPSSPLAFTRPQAPAAPAGIRLVP
jgi:hypothetical protein